MAQFKQWFEQDFTEKIEIRHCESVMFTGDDNGAIVGVYLYDNGTPYSGGGTVNGFVKRTDGGVVVINGTLSGNAASIVLPGAALAYAGPIGVQITLLQGGQTATVLKVIYSVDDTTGTPVDPGSLMPSLPELIAEANAAIAAMELKGQQTIASIPSDYTTVSDAAEAINPAIGLNIYGRKSTNLFNKNTLLPEHYLSGATGGIVAAQTSGEKAYCVGKAYIPVRPEYTYTSSAALLPVCYYKADGTFISYANNVTTFTTPENCYFVRVCFLYSNAAQFRLNEGTTLLSYEDYYRVPYDAGILLSSGSQNFFDKNAPDIIDGQFIASNIISANADYIVSGYTPVFDDTTYYLDVSDNTFVSTCFYDSALTYISATSLRTFRTPADAQYIRFNVLKSEINTAMLYLASDEPSNYTPYKTGMQLKNDVKTHPIAGRRRLYNLCDAIQHWKNGEKFPIAFAGDSTTAGSATSAYTDGNVVGTNYVCQTAYPYILEQKLKTLTGNNNIRVYNAGFSGTNVTYMLQNVRDEFYSSAYYNDTKMVGISYGINDRVMDKEVFKANLIELVQNFIDHEIQPFLITPQVTLWGASDHTTTENAYEMASQMSAIIRGVAEDYNLELVDMMHYSSRYLEFANAPLDSIIADALHFADGGHVFKADVFYSILMNGTIFATGDYYLSILNPLSRYTYQRRNIKENSTTYKKYVEYTDVSSAEKLSETDIFNDTQGSLEIRIDAEPQNAGYYVVVDGVTISDLSAYTMGYGLHTISVYAAAGTNGKYYGLSLTRS